MNYSICPNVHCSQRFSDWRTSEIIPYCAKHQLEHIYPNGGYTVIGEIGSYAKSSRYNQDAVVIGNGRQIPIYPLGSLRRPWEWVAGYAAVGEHLYVAVVRGVIPWLLLTGLSTPKTPED